MTAAQAYMSSSAPTSGTHPTMSPGGGGVGSDGPTRGPDAAGCSGGDRAAEDDEVARCRAKLCAAGAPAPGGGGGAAWETVRGGPAPGPPVERRKPAGDLMLGHDWPLAPPAPASAPCRRVAL
eukprot:CAMPEP_0185196514 /NCGR_PEP_ID=MMETSP1140-20130426/37738_1 /TAXON_ID=298111 /ORGANISM="Pavlova sp., Strain CCMP459" /LENGTH=122 /DNA_ID=CAMNT_0027763555 /DNA_START=43 /DNA_END=412 /DNA_ORIENTATION=-